MNFWGIIYHAKTAYCSCSTRVNISYRFSEQECALIKFNILNLFVYKGQLRSSHAFVGTTSNHNEVCFERADSHMICASLLCPLINTPAATHSELCNWITLLLRGRNIDGHLRIIQAGSSVSSLPSTIWIDKILNATHFQWLRFVNCLQSTVYIHQVIENE